MRLAGRLEGLFHAEMQLSIAEGEPDAAAPGEVLGLGDFRQSQKGTIELPRERFGAARHGDLHMVEPDDGHGLTASRLRGPACSRRTGAPHSS